MRANEREAYQTVDRLADELERQMIRSGQTSNERELLAKALVAGWAVAADAGQIFRTAVVARRTRHYDRNERDEVVAKKFLVAEIF